jgi:hypothetical protein
LQRPVPVHTARGTTHRFAIGSEMSAHRHPCASNCAGPLSFL